MRHCFFHAHVLSAAAARRMRWATRAAWAKATLLPSGRSSGQAIRARTALVASSGSPGSSVTDVGMRWVTAGEGMRVDQSVDEEAGPMVLGGFGASSRSRARCALAGSAQAARCARGMPSSAIRFSARVAIATSTRCASRPRDRSVSPRTRFRREKVASAMLRRP